VQHSLRDHFLADAPEGEQLRSQFSPGERILPAIQTTLTLYWIPYIFKIVLAFLFRVLLGDKDTAFALETAYVKTIAEERKLIVRRDELRRKWEQEWVSNDLDFVITVCAPFPGIENGTADKASLFQAGWVMLFSLVSSRLVVSSGSKYLYMKSARLLGGGTSSDQGRQDKRRPAERLRQEHARVSRHESIRKDCIHRVRCR